MLQRHGAHPPPPPHVHLLRAEMGIGVIPADFFVRSSSHDVIRPARDFGVGDLRAFNKLLLFTQYASSCSSAWSIPSSTSPS